MTGPGGENPTGLTSSVTDTERVKAAIRAREAGLGG